MVNPDNMDSYENITFASLSGFAYDFWRLLNSIVQHGS